MNEIEKIISKITFETLESYYTIKIIPDFIINNTFFKKHHYTFCKIEYNNQLRISGILKKDTVISGIQTSLLGAAISSPKYSPMGYNEILNSKITFYFSETKKEIKDFDYNIKDNDIIWLIYRNYSAMRLPEEKKCDTLAKELDFLCKKAGVTEKCWRDKESRIYKFETIKVEVKDEQQKNTDN